VPFIGFDAELDSEPISHRCVEHVPRHNQVKPDRSVELVTIQHADEMRAGYREVQ